MKSTFECTNCGNHPTSKSVIENHGSCEKCGDTVIAYTVDTAEYIENLKYEIKELQLALGMREP